jgi:uncharacterized protein
MQTYIQRFLTPTIHKRLKRNPAVAILGPRQCGKSTLAREILKPMKNAVYLDLERPSDANRLRDPEAFFTLNSSKLICLDEIQRLPEIFPVMRSVIDTEERNGQFLILGSASPQLLRQSSESLAGRISHIELTPFRLTEIPEGADGLHMRRHWLRGGFPRSYLAEDEAESFEWRQDFIRTFLERDLSQMGVNIQARRMKRFWQMCAHLHGQLLNSSKLGESLGLSHHTIRSYVDLLDHAFILKVLMPLEANLKKRLVKSPRVFIRDAGLLHALLGIESQNELLGHPVYGASWEGYVIENIVSMLPDWNAAFYRTASGTELDLILEKAGRRIAVECKVSTSPQVGRGFWNAIADLDVSEAWIISPVKEPYPFERGVTVAPPDVFIDRFMGSVNAW